MNDVEFERLLSTRPFVTEQPIRDMIFDHYLERYNGNQEKANEVLKAYTDELYNKFVNRKM